NDALRPLAPPAHGLAEMRSKLDARFAALGGPVGLLRPHELQPDVQLLFRPHTHGCAQAVVGEDLQRCIPEDPQTCVAADREVSMLTRWIQPGFDVAVIESRHEHDVELQMPAHTFDDADQLAPWPSP